MADRDAFDTATRIAAGDDGTNYDNVAISLHWATALLVIVQFVLAITWDYFSRDMRENLQSVHISLGVLLTAVILARIVWRLMPGHQRSAIVSGWVKLASKAVHYLLYALLVVQAALGFAWRWAQAETFQFFGLFPLRFATVRNGPLAHTFGDLHDIVGWTIVILAGLHATVALVHHYVLKDGVLRRMTGDSGT